MLLRAIVATTCGFALALAAASLHAQVGGNLAAGPPFDIHLEIATGPDGPVLSTTEFDLITGELGYPFNRSWRCTLGRWVGLARVRTIRDP